MYSPLFVTLMGIGTVFFGLICIIVLTTVMGSVLKSKSKPAAPAPAAPIRRRITQVQSKTSTAIRAIVPVRATYRSNGLRFD